MRRNNRFVRSAVIATIVLGLLAMSYAFAAANTMPAGDAKLGEGSQTISGFTITSIVYVLNAANPKNIDQVNFTAAPVPSAGATKKIKLVAAGTDWYTCTDPLSDGNLQCVTTAPQALVLPSDQLTIIIAQ